MSSNGAFLVFAAFSAITLIRQAPAALKDCWRSKGYRKRNAPHPTCGEGRGYSTSSF